MLIYDIVYVIITHFVAYNFTKKQHIFPISQPLLSDILQPPPLQVEIFFKAVMTNPL